MCLCGETKKSVENWWLQRLIVKMIVKTLSSSSFPLHICLILIGLHLVTPTHGYRVLSREPLPGCYHNGTRYGEGSLVPTLEPCLSCKCSNKILTCALKVCPEQPMPPPRGCVVVHPKTSCCPYMTCRRFNSKPTTEDDRRIVNFLDDFEHEQKIIQEKYGDIADGNTNALRRSESSEDEDGNVCIQNGTIYMPGSAMTSSSLCSYCYCIGGKQKCVKPKCLLPALADCTPVFIESNCCPVRYDCSERRATSKTDLLPRKKITNKHYMRNVTMMARGRGCFVNGILHTEGHRLPKDAQNPCEICYCIRGKRKCTPQKCSPEIKNCIPLIPPGQCCPSSYNCDDPGEKGRQFDLFSILFGEDDANATEVASEEILATTESIQGIAISTSSEKSFFDVLKEGLDLIDANEDKVGSLLGKNETTTKSNNTNAVFELLDINPESDTYYDYEDDDGGVRRNTTTPVTTKIYATTPITIIDAQTESLKILTTLQPLPAIKERTTEKPQTTTEKYISVSTTVLSTTETAVQTTETDVITTTIKPEVVQEIKTTTDQPLQDVETTSTLIVESTTEIQESDSTTESHIVTTTDVGTTTVDVDKADVKIDEDSILPESSSTTTTTENILTAFFSGLASILDKDSNKTKNITSTTTIPALEVKTTKLSSIDRIDEIASTTLVPVLTPQPDKVPEPVVIDSNPSILETDYHYDYSEPTLPPSLPNLKIIPFLPTDAVKNNRKKVVPPIAPYEYYSKHDPTLYPPSDKRIDYAPSYSQENLNFDPTAYPSITEAFDALNYDYVGEIPADKHAILGFGSFPGVVPVYKNSGSNDFEGEGASVFNYEQMNGFSPPKETEGGFLPKEPSKENFYYDGFRTTNFVVDLTTEISPPQANNNIPDPFKNVIRTEPPPDLHSLIEDKEKLLLNRVIINGTHQADFEQPIISITTDAPVDEDNNVVKNRESSSVASDVVTSTTEPAGGFFDGLFGLLFKGDETKDDDDITTVKTTTKFQVPPMKIDTMEVPEFKNLSQEMEIPEMLLDNVTIPPEKMPNDNVTVIRDILFDLLGEPRVDNKTEISITTETTTKAPSRLSVPYLTSSHQMNGGTFNPIRSSLDLAIPDLHNSDNNNLNNYSPDSYQILPDDTNISNTESYVVNPVDVEKLTEHHSEGEAQVHTKPVISSAADPVGLLKLAGCNIYGRMYRVGRIISELSGPCLECKCTEVGVHCTPLDC
ncbi:uncharacterized protein DMENIID0001_086450 [Sergentomyia squamirostris]